MDSFDDSLAKLLAFQGTPSDMFRRTIAERMHAHDRYREQTPNDENDGGCGPLIWEAAKHVGEPLGAGQDFVFLMTFVSQFLERLNEASIFELMTGRPD
jgi:hypothetical protein